MKNVLVSVNAMLLFACGFAQAQVSLTAKDRDEIQSLAAQYGKALGSCDAQGFANLFEPESGVFASGFRGSVKGRERLIALVESERHCLTPNADGSRGRPGGQNAPTVSLETTAAGVFGVIDLGAAAQYQDEYVRTPNGWRFASRTVITPPEKAAGLDARQMAAIQKLSADVPATDHYEVGDNGKQRFLSSGVVILVDAATVKGRVFLENGGRYDDVYEQTAPGQWRIRSRELVPATTK